jgi:hypothetical protein
MGQHHILTALEKLQSSTGNQDGSEIPIESTQATTDDHRATTTEPSVTSPPSSRIILTTYPKQTGINPVPLDWANSDPNKRGPVVVSRLPSTIRRRNAIGAHGGSYSIYYALAVASKQLEVDHMPDFTNTQPAVDIGPFPQWSDPTKIVAMDPLGHLAPFLFKETIQRESLDIRPSIAITKAHMKSCSFPTWRKVSKVVDSFLTERFVSMSVVILPSRR